jgi:hypothetical protein
VTEKLGRKRPDKGSHTAASKIENKKDKRQQQQPVELERWFLTP